jgi:putative ABC transport system permease protein
LPYKGLKSGRSLNFAEKQLTDVNDNLKETSGETGVIEKQLTITNNSEYGSYQIKGVNPNYLNIFNLKFEPNAGRFINELDLKASKKVIVIDKKIEEVLFKGKSSLGHYVQVGEVMFRVIGVNSKKERWGNGNAYIPFTTAQYIFNPNLKFYNIAMTVNGLDTKESNDAFNDKLKGTMSKSLRFDPNDTQALWIWNSQREYVETMKLVFSP